MTENQHTAGPWKVDREDGWLRVTTDFSSVEQRPIHEHPICCVAIPGEWKETPDSDEDTAINDAYLMAAAPDAHAILLAINEFFRHHNPAYPSTLFDDDRTLKQAVADYLAKATNPKE